MTVAAFRDLAHAATAGGGAGWCRCGVTDLLDTETPVAVFAKLREPPFAFLLESAPAGARRGRGTRSSALLHVPRGGFAKAWWKIGCPIVAGMGARRPTDPLADLDVLLRRYQPVKVPELGEFWSGAVGFFGYDVVRYIERLPNPPSARDHSPTFPTRCSSSRAR